MGHQTHERIGKLPHRIEVPGAKDLLPGMVVSKDQDQDLSESAGNLTDQCSQRFDKNYLWIVQNSGDGKTQKAERHEVELGLIIGQYVNPLRSNEGI